MKSILLLVAIYTLIFRQSYKETDENNFETAAKTEAKEQQVPAGNTNSEKMLTEQFSRSSSNWKGAPDRSRADSGSHIIGFKDRFMMFAIK